MNGKHRFRLGYRWQFLKMLARNLSTRVIGLILNHSPGTSEGVTAIYNRHSYLPEVRHALNAWAAHVERIVSGGDAGNVVDFAVAPT